MRQFRFLDIPRDVPVGADAFIVYVIKELDIKGDFRPNQYRQRAWDENKDVLRIRNAAIRAYRTKQGDIVWQIFSDCRMKKQMDDDYAIITEFIDRTVKYIAVIENQEREDGIRQGQSRPEQD